MCSCEKDRPCKYHEPKPVEETPRYSCDYCRGECELPT